MTLSEHRDLLVKEATLVATDFFPAESDTAFIQARLQRQYHQIRLLDEAIIAAREQLEQLIRNRDRLNASCLATVSLFSPIRKLPIEILEKVFFQAINLKDPDESEQYDNANDFFDPKLPHPHDVRISISLVCRRWRLIVTSTPKLWGRIALNDGHVPELATIVKWFVLSKAAPIDMYIDAAALHKRWDQADFRKLMALVQHSMARMSTLFIRRSLFLPSFSFYDFFPITECTLAPQMKSFKIIDGDDAEVLTVPNRFHAPNLQICLAVPSCIISSLTASTLSGLRYLSLSLDHMSPMAVDALAFCPSLEILHFRSYRIRVTPGGAMALSPDVSAVQIILPSLKVLRVPSGDSVVLAAILNRIRTPRLEHLIVDSRLTFLKCSTFCDGSTPFLYQNLPFLRKVTLERVGSIFPTPLELFSHLPMITSLEILWSFIPSNLFDSLALRDVEMKIFTCPRLREIAFYNSSFSTTDFGQLLHTRLGALEGHEPPNPLRVKVANCISLLDNNQANEKQMNFTNISTIYKDILAVEGVTERRV